MKPPAQSVQLADQLKSLICLCFSERAKSRSCSPTGYLILIDIDINRYQCSTETPMLPKPLKPQLFHILLALSSSDLHGYGIQRAVLQQTDGHIHLWPAMLYRSLTKLEEAGLLEKADPPADQPADERRGYYTLTAPGRQRLADEARVLARWAEAARESLS